jgi:two-component system chemotaxis response regulator CheY
MKILIVDDSKTMRMIIGRTLKELGHETREAGNGREAITALKAETGWGLVMADWNMPEMNGLEMVIAVKAEEVFKPLPIMMVTTETELSNVQKAMDAGAAGFIMKPFKKEAIQEKIATLTAVQA